ncbi:MAG: protein tyrosine phosphatase [Gammaproteobacteria bacterium]|nr:protein tyrosine phosphatase [Gammaproteobacteria bacterium]MDH3409458.1 protein tyrosine phosphatase [Gammaproteobacteria bacterium]MDH3553215.1 protein tyrosine phosphatase [Gammaproteobacteria bacterium]
MQPTFYKVETIGSGFLAIVARPRGNDRAEEEFASFADCGIKRMLSLLEMHEEYVLGLENEADLCASANIDFYSFPIRDRGVPSDVNALSDLSKKIYLDCFGGQNTAIHCRTGIGRSSLVAAAVLLHAGISADEAFSRIQDSRGLEVPDTPEQAQWLRDNSRTILEAGVPNRALH